MITEDEEFVLFVSRHARLSAARSLLSMACLDWQAAVDFSTRLQIFAVACSNLDYAEPAAMLEESDSPTLQFIRVSGRSAPESSKLADIGC